MTQIKDLFIGATEVRRRTLEMICSASGGHIGGSLSSVDILVALYFKVLQINPLDPDDPARDRFILSKGHSVESYYAVFARKERARCSLSLFSSTLCLHE